MQGPQSRLKGDSPKVAFGKSVPAQPRVCVNRGSVFPPQHMGPCIRFNYFSENNRCMIKGIMVDTLLEL